MNFADFSGLNVDFPYIDCKDIFRIKNFDFNLFYLQNENKFCFLTYIQKILPDIIPGKLCKVLR